MTDSDPDTDTAPDPTDPEVWDANNDRLAWVQRHRDVLMDATGKDVPQSIPAIADWLDDHKSAMTQKLQQADDSTDTEPTDGGDNE